MNKTTKALSTAGTEDEAVKKRERLIIFIYFAVIVLYQLFMREYKGDAIHYYSHFLDNNTFKEALTQRYEYWTSRMLIEMILIPMAHNMHVVIYGFLNVAFEMLLYLSTITLLHKKHLGLTTFLFLIYPILSMGAVGWMASFVNYLWTLAAAVFSLLMLQRMYEGKKTGFLMGSLFLIAEIFGTDFETCAVFYAVILAWFIFAMAAEKKFTGKRIAYTVLMCMICALSIANAVICPGNRYRLMANTTSFMKYFVSMSFFDKVTAGINATFSVFTDRSILFFFFAAMLFIATLLRKDRPEWLVYVSAAPLAFVVLRTILKPVTSAYFSEASDFLENLNSTRVDAVNYDRPTSYLLFILYMAIILSIITVYAYSFKDTVTSLKYTAVFIGALCTRVAMGFSPTLYHSADKTFIFVDIAFIWLTVNMYDEYHEQIEKNVKLYRASRFICPFIAGAAVIQNIAAIVTLY